MAALFDDPAPVDHKDHVSGCSATWTIRSLAVSRALEATSRISTFGSLSSTPADGEALLLAAGQPVAAFPHHGVVALGELHDPIMYVRRGSGRLDLGVARRRLGVGDVVADGGVKEVRLLRHHPDRVGDARQRNLPDAAAVEQDPGLASQRTGVGRVTDGGLAGAGRPGAQIAQDLLAHDVGQVGLVEPESACHHRDRAGARR